MPATFLPDMFAQQLVGFGIENADVKRIPLDVDELSNPAWWNAVIGRIHFDASIQMNGAFAVLVVTERLQWQWKQGRLFFGEHCRYLTLGCAVNARVGPAPLPLIQIRLSLFETFETQSLQRCLFGVADARFHFSFAIRISDATRHGDDAVVRQHIFEQWIDCGIVDVWGEDAFLQVIENHDTTGAA